VSRLVGAASAAVVLIALALSLGGAPAGQSARAAVPLRFAQATLAPRQPAGATSSASAWCGDTTATDRGAPVVPGRAVHLIYAYPADGADRLAQFGSVIQTDVETIDGWWRGQDATRTPRFDLFAFPCGPQVDISDVKLPQSGAALTPISSRFNQIVSSLVAAGFASDYEIYVVYYDGPDDGGGVCGEGGTADPSHGRAFAVVFPAGCPREPTAPVAVHELVHALGAVTAPAPHECPPPNDGHVCDSNRDLMYPYVDGSPLSSLVLDVGRDDYYGATGVGFDVRTSGWLRHLDEPQAHLTISIAGAGSVDSDVPGVACTASCASDWDGGQAVTLSATPASGMRFVRWGGACTGSSTCAPTVMASTSVTALFAPKTYLLTIGVLGRGAVSTSATPSPCRLRCRVPVTSYQAVTLRAITRAGWRFARWTGACRGSRLSCRLPMSSNVAATAVFAKKS